VSLAEEAARRRSLHPADSDFTPYEPA
jgi:hypothetical protein